MTALCCERYGPGHDPAFSVAGCPKDWAWPARPPAGMTPEHLIQTVGAKNGTVPVEVALRAVRQARHAETGRTEPLLHEGDRPVAMLSPDAHLVIDASTCIVIATPERRITVGHVRNWQDQLENAKTFARIYQADAEQRAAGLP